MGANSTLELNPVVTYEGKEDYEDVKDKLCEEGIKEPGYQEGQETKPNWRECKHLLKLFRFALLAVLKENTTDCKKRAAAWVALENFWNEVATPIGEGAREAKAQTVKELAKVFIQAFTHAASADKMTVYMHVAYQHLPATILEHDDLLDFAGEGLENLHTKIHAAGTNKRQRTEKPNTRRRTYQAFEKVAVSQLFKDEVVPRRIDNRAQRDLASKLRKRKGHATDS
ncbi:hypothetical protein CYMTET_21721 [Cymbomonas tetramitiformis]|uniref:Uncharacterized protein n=1 Tax=Cymbomonas tetramitiformis TaxID=36881 RepID=A0AAE0L2W3_9CHLO|nr:hypothetical protein CYMTET_21721 [Cymbomonas tetramitiformis]